MDPFNNIIKGPFDITLTLLKDLKLTKESFHVIDFQDRLDNVEEKHFQTFVKNRNVKEKISPNTWENVKNRKILTFGPLLYWGHKSLCTPISPPHSVLSLQGRTWRFFLFTSFFSLVPCFYQLHGTIVQSIYWVRVLRNVNHDNSTT